MTSLSFTPLVQGQPNNAADVNTPLTAIQTILNGGVDSSNVTDGTLTPSDLTTALQDLLGVTGNVVRRGKAIYVPSSDSRTNAAYGLLANQDKVANIVMPTDGLISVWYQATWQESVAGAARAAIFVGATQLKMASPGGVPLVEEVSNGGTINTDVPLVSYPMGLASAGAVVGGAGDVTTGQVVGISSASSQGGPCYIFAAAGTYDISVQFKASSGNVVAKNRRLWVEARAF